MIEVTLSSRHRIRNSEPWRSEAEHATSRSRRLPTILSQVYGKETIVFLLNRREPNSGVKGSCANHYARAPTPNMTKQIFSGTYVFWGD